MPQERQSEIRGLGIGIKPLIPVAAFFIPFTVGWVISSLWATGIPSISDAAYASGYENMRWWFIGTIIVFVLLVMGIDIMKRFSAEEKSPLFPAKITALLFIAGISLASSSDRVQQTFSLALEDPSGISQFIIVTMLAGLGIIFYHFFFLQKEYREVLRITSLAGQIAPGDPVGFHKTLSFLDSSGGLLKEKWLNLKHALESDLSPDYELLISFPDQRELLKESKLAFFVKILPIMGMVGTILGFTLAVVGMQTAATNMSDFSTFKGNLLEALGGMKVAFLTTLTGLVSMAILMWLNSQMEEARRHILLLEAELLYIRVYLPWKNAQLLREPVEPDSMAR